LPSSGSRRTLDDSANRRLVLPEAFLATDAILVLANERRGGSRGCGKAEIAGHVAKAHCPSSPTERLLMRGVKAGGDRQQLHEVIRRHSLTGEEGLLDRLARDPAFKQLGVARGCGDARSRGVRRAGPHARSTRFLGPNDFGT